MKNYRMVVGDVYQKDIVANDSNEAMNKAIQIACQHGYRNSGLNVCVMEIKDGIKQIGIEFEAYDRVFKEKHHEYLFVMANDESEARQIYQKTYAGKRFWFNASNPSEDGKNEYGKIIRTYYCCC